MNLLQMKEIQMLKDIWVNSSERDRRAFFIGAVCVCLFLVYALIWLPTRSSLESQRQALKDQTELLIFVRDAEAKLNNVDDVALRKEEVKSPLDLLTFLKIKIDDFSLNSALASIKQAGDRGVSLSFKNIQFDDCMRFLIAVLNAKKVEVRQFSATSLSENGGAKVDVIIAI